MLLIPMGGDRVPPENGNNKAATFGGDFSIGSEKQDNISEVSDGGPVKVSIYMCCSVSSCAVRNGLSKLPRLWGNMKGRWWFGDR